MSNDEIHSMKLTAKKNCKKYTLFRHYKLLDKILNVN